MNGLKDVLKEAASIKASDEDDVMVQGLSGNNAEIVKINFFQKRNKTKGIKNKLLYMRVIEEYEMKAKKQKHYETFVEILKKNFVKLYF